MRKPIACRHRGLSTCLVFLLAALTAIRAQASPPANGTPRYDPQRTDWASMEFHATKLWLSAQATMSATARPQADIAAQLVAPASGQPVPATEQVMEIRYGARGMGRTSDTTLWLDAATGAAVQRTQVDGGSRMRHRVYRYTDSGAWHQTRHPANSREGQLPPDRWTDRSEGLRPYPPEAGGLVITDPAALLWLIAAADLTKAGDEAELFTFSRRRVHRVSVRVTGMTTARVDYRETAGASARQRKGEIPALRFLVRGQPLHEEDGEDDEFELLGLQGDIELLLEPASRAPLALGGRARIVGAVVFRLRQLTLR